MPLGGLVNGGAKCRIPQRSSLEKNRMISESRLRCSPVTKSQRPQRVPARRLSYLVVRVSFQWFPRPSMDRALFSTVVCSGKPTAESPQPVRASNRTQFVDPPREK